MACNDGQTHDTNLVSKPILSFSKPSEHTPLIRAKQTRRHKSPRTFTTVYDLYDNRVHAHRFFRQTWIAIPQPGSFAKYIPFGSTHAWKLGTTRNGIPVAKVRGRAQLAIPPLGTSFASPHLHLKVYVKRSGTLSMQWNKTKLPRQRLAPGWQTITAKISPTLLTNAKNRLILRVLAQTNLEIATVSISPSAHVLDLDDETISVEQTASQALVLTPTDTLSYYVAIPKAARLIAQPLQANCVVQARITNQQGSFTKNLSTSNPYVDLSNMGDTIARIDLGIRSCETATLENVRIEAIVPTPLKLRNGPPPRNVVLWIMDTLRADKLPIINESARTIIPGLTRLAQRGVVFRRNYVQGNESQTSHSSIWSSLYPAVHNVRSAGRGGTWRLSSRFTTIAKQLKNAGLQTIALTANGMVTRNSGYGAGFDVFKNPMRDGTGKRRNGWIPASRMYKRALELLSPRIPDPFLFFFGTIDTHKPWVGHQPWLQIYDPNPYRGQFKNAAWPGDLGLVRGSMRCTKQPNERDLQRIHAIYDSAISYQDAYLNKFLDWLEEKKLLEETLIVVTADHGEELWEDGRCGHGASLRETLVHVPLIVSYPARLPSGAIVTQGVDGVDIFPTILDLMQLEPVAQAQGQSLRRLAHGVDSIYPTPSYASQYEYAHAMRIQQWKVRVGRRVELYNLAVDPFEQHSVADSRPIERQYMLDVLRLFLRYRSHWRKSSWGTASNLRPDGVTAMQHTAQTQLFASKP